MHGASRFARELAARVGPVERRLVAALAAAAALILGFGLLAAEVGAGSTDALDRAILLAIRGSGAAPPGPPWVQEVGRDVTALGSFVVLGFLLAGAVGFLLLVQKRGAAGLMLISVLGGTLLSTLLKFFFERPRPELPHAARVFTASFPSGHATLSAVAFLTIGALLMRVTERRRAKLYVMAVAVFLTVAVGLSRLYLGVHYPSDVLAGWAVGSAWAILCWAAALFLQRRGRVEGPRDGG